MSLVFFIFIGLLFLAFLYTLIILRKFFFLVLVSGESMLPTLQEGDFLLAIRQTSIRKIVKNQIIVWQPPFNHPVRNKLPYSPKEVHFIKRLVGLPGEEVKLNYYGKISSELEMQSTIKIPLGYCFVQGDSPGYDSHVIGPIPLDWIQGIVIFRIKRQKALYKFPRRNF